jgi:hypothetical protein
MNINQPVPAVRQIKYKLIHVSSRWMGSLSARQSPCAFIIRYHVRTAMTDAQEERLSEALTKVDVHGDLARTHAQDPMTAVLGQRAVQADLMRWDDSRGHYVLTGTGRSRISARSRAPGVVVRFKRRNDRSTAPPTDD